MASTITAGNATNGLGISSDNTGILQIKTGAGAGTAALTLNATQNATFAGVVTSPTGALYPLVLGTAQNSTSGTSIDFTSIPATAKRITVIFDSVSTDVTAVRQVQLGDSGGVEGTGYVCASSFLVDAGSADTVTSTTGLVFGGGGNPTSLTTGHMTLTNITGNTWVCSGCGSTNTTSTWLSGGAKTLSGSLDRVRITTASGTAIFDSGSINIMWE